MYDNEEYSNPIVQNLFQIKFPGKSNVLVGKVMWEDGRCYEIKTPPEDCEDMYDIKTKNETETVTVSEEENLEDLLVIDCITFDEKYITHCKLQTTFIYIFFRATFDNCAARSSDWMCLAKRKPPMGNIKKDISDIL